MSRVASPPDLPADELTDEEREHYEYLVDEFPDHEVAEIARNVLATYDEEEETD